MFMQKTVFGFSHLVTSIVLSVCLKTEYLSGIVSHQCNMKKKKKKDSASKTVANLSLDSLFRLRIFFIFTLLVLSCVL